MMRSSAAKFVAILAFALTAANATSWAEDDDEEERHQLQMMRSAVERGEAKPLSEILQIASAAHPGEVVGVEFEAKGKSWVYEIKVADKAGRLVEIHISAANGQVLNTEEK